MPQLVEALSHKRGDPRFDFRWSPWNISWDLIRLSVLRSTEVHSVFSRSQYHGNSLKGKVKVRLTHRADTSAVRVVPNVKVRMQDQRSNPM